ncbi:MAG: DUF507 family protein [Deltaproteobacteria bacterium]|nr:MAG: DUF507 family protein [Deltaproteobacteria bacterium]
MKLYPKKFDQIATEIVDLLIKDGDIEVETPNREEVAQDIVAVMNEYLQTDSRLNEEVSDLMARKGIPATEFGRVKKILMEEKGIKTGDEGIEWAIDQILQSFMIGSHVEEVYTEDRFMKSKIFSIFQKHFDIDDELDKEARSKLKNLKEGTADWDIEYKKAFRQALKRRGLI